MEAGKEQELQGDSASWRPRIDHQWCGSSQRLQIQDTGESLFQLESKGRKKPDVSFKGSQVGRILPNSGEGQPFCTVQDFS